MLCELETRFHIAMQAQWENGLGARGGVPVLFGEPIRF
jgi:hypothetical protein